MHTNQQTTLIHAESQQARLQDLNQLAEEEDESLL